MADSFSITIDGAALREALMTLPQAVKPFVKAASRISADNIAREAAARLDRQLSGTSTGETVASIKVFSRDGGERGRGGWGWVVVAGDGDPRRVAAWLERGTVHMAARSFFDASAHLEAGAHEGRIQAAVQAAIHEHGLGATP